MSAKRVRKETPEVGKLIRVERAGEETQDAIERTVCISNLPFSTRYVDVYDRFIRLGMIQRIKFWHRPVALRFVKCCTVEMETKELAANAIEQVTFNDLFPGQAVQLTAYRGGDDQIDVKRGEYFLSVKPFPWSMNKYAIWRNLELLFIDYPYTDMTFLRVKGRGYAHVEHFSDLDQKRMYTERWVLVYFKREEDRDGALSLGKREVLGVNVTLGTKKPRSTNIVNLW